MSEEAAVTLSGTPAHLKSTFDFRHGDGWSYLGFPTRIAAITKWVARDAKGKSLEFRRFRRHDLRHWYTVDYLRRGGNIYDLQHLLGHDSIKTTERYLAYLTVEQQKQAKYGVAQKGTQ